MLTNFHGNKAKKIFFFWKKKFKMADSKKGHFSTLSILNIFFWKFHGSVLGLVGLIDAKGIDGAQPIWSWGCLTWAQKQAKNAFLSLCRTAFPPYRLSHINALGIIQSYLPKDQFSKFSQKILRIGGFEKWPFFESAILIFFFSKKEKKIVGLISS